MVKIKFKTFGANSAFGSFGPGDVLQCSEAMARHLVDEIGCAKYLTPTAAPVVDEGEEPAVQKPRKVRK